jgi:hypothetical protein
MGGGTIQERFALQFVDGCYNQTGSGEDKGGFASLALEPNTNSVNLSYYDYNNGDLRYAYKEDSSNVWYTMSIDGSGTIIVGSHTSLAVDNSGNRHISYYDTDNSGLKYAYGPAGTADISWQLYIVDTSGNVGQYTSLALDNSGNRHISYYDTTNDDLKYAYGPAGTGDISWQLYNVDTSGNVGEHTSIAIEPNTQKPSISYFKNNVAGSNEIRIATQNSDLNTRWEIGVLDSSLIAIAFNGNSQLAFDANSNTHLSYYDYLGTEGRLRYALDPAGQYGDSCPIFTTTTFDVSMQEVSVSAETIGVNFSLNQTSPSFQLPFDVSSHIVPDCPAE